MAKLMREVLNEIDPKPATAGDLIVSARKKLDLTQEEVCKLTNLKRENLSALENGRIEMSVHYAEIFGALFGLHPASILFPNGEYEKTDALVKIEKRAREFLKRKQAV